MPSCEQSTKRRCPTWSEHHERPSVAWLEGDLHSWVRRCQCAIRRGDRGKRTLAPSRPFYLCGIPARTAAHSRHVVAGPSSVRRPLFRDLGYTPKSPLYPNPSPVGYPVQRPITRHPMFSILRPVRYRSAVGPSSGKTHNRFLPCQSPSPHLQRRAGSSPASSRVIGHPLGDPQERAAVELSADHLDENAATGIGLHPEPDRPLGDNELPPGHGHNPTGESNRGIGSFPTDRELRT